MNFRIGKLLILLLARRLVTPDFCLVADAKFLNNKFAHDQLPIFPEMEDRLKGLDTPFIDPSDGRGEEPCMLSLLFYV
jgi:hypothetical protein